MKSFKSKIEAIFSAATFAEANEHETALGFLRRYKSSEAPTERAWGQKNGPDYQHQTTSFRKTIEDHFMAAAFAEAGAFDTAQEMLLNYRRKRKVLLAIEGEEPNQATFEYTVNLCRRINADLHILQIVTRNLSGKEATSDNIAGLKQVLEQNDISFEISRREVLANNALYEHLKDHRDVSVAVVDSPNLRGSREAQIQWRETFRKITQKLSVPLVTALQR
jgi:hypothetical protein